MACCLERMRRQFSSSIRSVAWWSGLVNIFVQCHILIQYQLVLELTFLFYINLIASRMFWSNWLASKFTIRCTILKCVKAWHNISSSFGCFCRRENLPFSIRRDRKNRDMTLTQIAILPSRDLLVITKLRLPLYHIQNSLFSTKFFQKKYWANYVKHSIIWKSQIHFIKADPGKLNISDCLVIGSYEVEDYVDTEIMYNHIEKIAHIVVSVPTQYNIYLPFSQY